MEKKGVGNAILVLVLVAVLAVAAVLVLLVIMGGNDVSVVACPADAKLCPDGTAVGRVAPDCEFAPCPEPAANASEPVGCPEDARVCSDGTVVVRVAPDCEFEACPEVNETMNETIEDNATLEDGTPNETDEGNEIVNLLAGTNCEYVTFPDQKGRCVTDLAKDTMDPKYCSVAGDWREKCLLELVKVTKDISMCEYDRWTYSAECVEWMYDWEDDTSECLKLDRFRDVCIMNQTLENKDYGYCRYVEEERDRCYYNVGITHFINDSCKYIVDDEMQEECFDVVALNKRSLYECTDLENTEAKTDCIKDLLEIMLITNTDCNKYFDDDMNAICKAVIHEDTSYCSDIGIITRKEWCIKNCC